MSEKIEILVHIEGGAIQGVFATNPSGVEIIIRDADIEGVTDYIREDSDGKRYQEYEAIPDPWDALETKPFEADMVFDVGNYVNVPEPEEHDSWNNSFAGYITQIYDEDDGTPMAVVQDADDYGFAVELERLTHY